MGEPELEFHVPSGLWWPKVESIDRCFGYMLNRVCDVDYLVKYTRSRAVCVQAGGFIGMWPRRLARTFEVVYTFEPIPTNFKALEDNTAMSPNVISRQAALSDHTGHVNIGFHRSGCSRVEPDGVPTECLTIDALDLPRCDAIYLDVEKHEVEALRGAEATIKRFAPTIMLETHPNMREAQDRWMSEHGYQEIAHVHSDRVFVRK